MHVPRQRLEGIGLLGQRQTSLIRHARQDIQRHSAQQRRTIGKPPVQRADAHPRSLGDLLEWRARAAIGEDVAGRDQNLVAVPARIGTHAWRLTGRRSMFRCITITNEAAAHRIPQNARRYCILATSGATAERTILPFVYCRRTPIGRSASINPSPPDTATFLTTSSPSGRWYGYRCDARLRNLCW